jgi:hypothetical protein
MQTGAWDRGYSATLGGTDLKGRKTSRVWRFIRFKALLSRGGMRLP